VKLESENFARAAEITAEHKAYACAALHSATGDMFSWERDFFAAYFMPENTTLMKPWFGKYYSPKNQLARSLALLLMEQIAKDLQ
jgi:hypothetical protein